MAAIRAKFDGHTIEIPPERHGAAPGDVLIVYPAGEPLAGSSGTGPSSIWDLVGKAPRQRTTEEINAQIRRDRDSWDKQ